MGKKKKFIDKKKAATFQLLARDSSDPNYDGTPGGDRVFVRVDNNPYSTSSFFTDDCRDDISGDGHYDDHPNSIFADAPGDDDDGVDDSRVYGNSSSVPAASRPGLPEHVRKEILELGFPDDGYNYLIHLKEIKNTGGGSAFYHNPKAKLEQLPRDVKAYDASRVRVNEVKDDGNDKSIYGIAAKTVGVRVQKAADPEVAALLDDCDLSRFGSDIEDLEEDFVLQANCPEEGEDVVTDNKLSSVEESMVVERGSKAYVAGGNQYNADDQTEKPRVRRLLDEQFDLLELHEYGTDDDDNDPDGYIAEEEQSLAEKLSRVLNDRPKDELELDDKYEVPADMLHGKERPKSKEELDSATDLIRRCMEYAEKYENEDKDAEVVIVQESSDDSEEWDCETIVSTYSNLDNHPGKIKAPEINRKKKLAETISGALSAPHVISLRGKEKLPIDFLPRSSKAVTEKLKGVDEPKTEPQKRKQHGQESMEEKKERKAAVKEERREARRVKKEMKGLYLCETQRAQRVAAISGPSSIHLM